MNRFLDVSGLPSYKFSHHSLMWWGVMGMIAIEGTVFALAVMAYFYLWSQANAWPMSPPPDLLWGTLNVAILLLSGWPNHWTKRAGEDGDERKMKLGLTICLAFGVALLVVRGFEFAALNTWWDSNAYGSIVWLVMGFHTLHLLTDAIETFVLTVFVRIDPGPQRLVEVSEDCMYWNFVVLAWLPLYAVVYWLPRWT